MFREREMQGNIVTVYWLFIWVFIYLCIFLSACAVFTSRPQSCLNSCKKARPECNDQGLHSLAAFSLLGSRLRISTALKGNLNFWEFIKLLPKKNKKHCPPTCPKHNGEHFGVKSVSLYLEYLYLVKLQFYIRKTFFVFWWLHLMGMISKKSHFLTRPVLGSYQSWGMDQRRRNPRMIRRHICGTFQLRLQCLSRYQSHWKPLKTPRTCCIPLIGISVSDKTVGKF